MSAPTEPDPQPMTDPVVHTHHSPAMDNDAASLEMMDPVDSSPTTWLLANDCPSIEETHIHQQDNCAEEVGMKGSHILSPSKHQSSNNKTSVRPSAAMKRGLLQSPRYRSAPIIAAAFHQQCESFPSVPIRTTSPQSCS